MKRPVLPTLFGTSLLFLPAGCRSDAPEDTTGAEASGTEGGESGTEDGEGEGSGTEGGGCEDPGFPEIDETDCEPLATDFSPGADDAWAACAADDGEYHLLGESTPGSAARIQAYEDMAPYLWANPAAPTVEDFTAARDLYAQDQGLESRVVRREDSHHPAIPMEEWDAGVDPDKQCTVAANVTAHPDRCAGPAKIAPVIDAAFEAGQLGTGDPWIHAAHIDAGILWFLYLSVYKECASCTYGETFADCDSCWAYYTGAFDRAGGLGLSKLVKDTSEAGHDAIFDAILASRCWREQYDYATYASLADVPADGQMLFHDGWEQLDNALHRGFALLIRARVLAQAGECGTAQGQANWEFLKVAGPVLDREAEERDPGAAAALRAIWAAPEPTGEDLATVVDLLDATFGCPQCSDCSRGQI